MPCNANVIRTLAFLMLGLCLITLFTERAHEVVVNVVRSETGGNLGNGGDSEMGSHGYGNGIMEKDSENPGSKVRLVCWQIYAETSHLRATLSSQQTWAKGCDVWLVFGTERSPNITVTLLNVTATTNHAETFAALTKAAWFYVHALYANQADYFVQTHHDTYVIVENLKEFLSHRDPTNAEYFGHGMKQPGIDYVYMDAVLVISKEALNRLVNKAFKMDPPCFSGTGTEKAMAACLFQTGSKPVNATDDQGRERFMSWDPHTMMLGKFPDWYKKDSVNKVRSGMPHCCHDYPLTFGRVSAHNKQAIHWILYNSKRHKDFIIQK